MTKTRTIGDGKIDTRTVADVLAYKAELHEMLDRDSGCHLSEQELCCHDTYRTPYPENRVNDGTLDRLIETFEAIRTACGNKPIRVNCAFRTIPHNFAVGGGKHSQHLEGKALDLQPPKGMTVADFHETIWTCAEVDGSHIGGIGVYDTFVHVDIRDRLRGRIARWDDRSAK